MKFGMLKRAAAVAAALAVSASMTACVNQHPEETTAGSMQTTAAAERLRRRIFLHPRRRLRQTLRKSGS